MRSTMEYWRRNKSAPPKCCYAAYRLHVVSNGSVERLRSGLMVEAEHASQAHGEIKRRVSSKTECMAVTVGGQSCEVFVKTYGFLEFVRPIDERRSPMSSCFVALVAARDKR